MRGPEPGSLGGPLIFDVGFTTGGEIPGPAEVQDWLQQRGEPFTADESGTIELRALAVSLDRDAEGRMSARFSVSPVLDLTRMVDLLFELSIRIGADVRLSGVGEVSRGQLWLRLADEQDRLRIADALETAEVHGRLDEVSQRLWQVVGALRPGHDDRWDVGQRQIVELLEVGSADGISLGDAVWHGDDPQPGDLVAVRVDSRAHTLAWRWLSEAYPGLAEAELTFH